MDGPQEYEVVAPRMNELAAWFRCNDVKPEDVPYPPSVFIETENGVDWIIRFDAYARGPSGRIVWDPVGEEFEFVERTAVMVNDPPMWWLKEAPPTTKGASS
jgi:hypothetical protein